ncbi:MAG TPA: hypothetical protein VEF34_09660 [Syntrophobacteraceae bacterium]|nr:hypothetical protein [Syntrophobacteraceae bacterium]
MFTRDTPYTRKQIQTLVGGELPTYLPQKNQRILAGCFSVEMNPNAPREIFAGDRPKVRKKAELLARQPGNVFPVFIKEKQSDREYFFRAMFKCQKITNDGFAISKAEALSGRHRQLAYVIYLDGV